MVVSFLGYEKVVIDTYDSNEFYEILLNESIDSLDEIVISTNDGMPREIKLEQFRKQFLGFSKFAKSCKILNEYDVIFRYKKSSKELIATAKSPIIIQNEELQYLVYFDIKSFVIEYNFVKIENKTFKIKGVSYTGTTFYESQTHKNDKKVDKKEQRLTKDLFCIL